MAIPFMAIATLAQAGAQAYAGWKKRKGGKQPDVNLATGPYAELAKYLGDKGKGFIEGQGVPQITSHDIEMQKTELGEAGARQGEEAGRDLMRKLSQQDVANRGSILARALPKLKRQGMYDMYSGLRSSEQERLKMNMENKANYASMGAGMIGSAMSPLQQIGQMRYNAENTRLSEMAQGKSEGLADIIGSIGTFGKGMKGLGKVMKPKAGNI